MSKQDQSPDSCCNDENSKSLLKENEPQKKVKIEAECEEIGCIHWISQLPDALIIKILSLLSVKDAFRTTILSKRWQYLCTSIDNFIYDTEEYSRSDSSTVHKFISLMDNVLPRLSCSSIKKFRLKFAFDYDDGVSYNPKIDKCLEFAVNKKVEDLYLCLWYTVDAIEVHDQPYSLPQDLCSSSSIVKLECENCRISEDCVLNWISLKSLTLGYLFIRDEHIEQIMSNCPQLESLELNGFSGFKRLHMTSPKCTRLELYYHYHTDGNWGSFEDDCCFEIVAPYVQHLKISGNFDDAKIRLRDLSSLVHAALTFNRYEYDAIDENTVKDLLVSVRCANELMLSSWFIKEISGLMFQEENVSLPLLECRWLTISSYITNYSFSGLDNLLRSTPYLENLMIFPDDVPGSQRFRNENIDFWGDNNYLCFQENIFKVFLQNLKNVKVVPPFCSCNHKADATELPQFLKFLVEHAINLEKLIIAPEGKGCNSCSIDISKLMKYLLAFPKTSNNAVISLGSVTKKALLNYH